MPVLGYLPATEHNRAPGQRSEENNVTGFDRPEKESLSCGWSASIHPLSTDSALQQSGKI